MSVQHTIVAGDTSSSLSEKFEVTPEAIKEANPGVDQENLQIGQAITIPGNVENLKSRPNTTNLMGLVGKYIVVCGETFYSIGEKVDISTAAFQNVQRVSLPETARMRGPPSQYIVEDGATLFSIGEKFHITTEGRGTPGRQSRSRSNKLADWTDYKHQRWQQWASKWPWTWGRSIH